MITLFLRNYVPNNSLNMPKARLILEQNISNTTPLVKKYLEGIDASI